MQECKISLAIYNKRRMVGTTKKMARKGGGWFKGKGEGGNFPAGLQELDVECPEKKREQAAMMQKSGGCFGLSHSTTSQRYVTVAESRRSLP